jgi:hypothetical protein
MVRRKFDADGPGGNTATDQFFAGFDGIQPTLEFDGGAKEDLTHRYLWGLQADQLLADEQVSSTSSDGDILWTLGDQTACLKNGGFVRRLGRISSPVSSAILQYSVTFVLVFLTVASDIGELPHRFLQQHICS